MLQSLMLPAVLGAAANEFYNPSYCGLSAQGRGLLRWAVLPHKNWHVAKSLDNVNLV